LIEIVDIEKSMDTREEQWKILNDFCPTPDYDAQKIVDWISSFFDYEDKCCELEKENEKLKKEIEKLKEGVDKTLWRRLYLAEEALSNIRGMIDFVDDADLKDDDAFPDI
jgi:uncharacterized protein YhaN